MGKRIDSLTGDVYHVTFDPPTKADIKKRLVNDPNSEESVMVTRLQEYHRNIKDVMRCYQHDKLQTKVVSADQPRDDVLAQVKAFLSAKTRTTAPHTPRVLLLGPSGSGKSVQAKMLEEKYQLINVCFKDLVQQTLESDSLLGQGMKPYNDRNVGIPDELLLKCLTERLGQLDATKRGWVLHGFPTTRMQVDSMVQAGYEPNRVIVLDAPNDVSVERMSLRAIDPVTGERYHLLYNPPRTADVKARLKVHKDDEEAAVMSRCTVYQNEIEDILEYYSDAQHINADQDVTTVFESIESVIVNPLPRTIESSSG
jgi:adenylate kinase